MRMMDFNNIFMILIILSCSIYLCEGQAPSPTSVPSSQPSNYTDNVYFDADIIMIVGLLLVYQSNYPYYDTQRSIIFLPI